MNPRTFLKRFEASVDRERLMWAIFDEMQAFARSEGITIDDVSHDEMEQLADAFVERGLAVPRSDETRQATQDWRSSHGLRHTLGFERTSDASSGYNNVYRFAVRRNGEWEYIDCESTLPVRSLQNRL